ncbi:MAG TPA: amidohydrolase family protein [Bryobacteraceae bacterium]|nr:amidohydrolase family protein [Bryobacteraceae bacterium]
MTRRVVLAFLLAASALIAQDLDVLIRNGSVLDGSGSAATKVDIGISGDRIVFIGKGAGKKAKREIDATGLIVAPGFIDPHTHSLEDLSNPARRRNDNYLMQGVTTVVTGNDGQGPIDTGAVLHKWEQQGIGTNAALYVGQGAIRREVMGMSDVAPSPEQLERMKSLVDRAMKDGAIGMSTGLYYAPGNFAKTEEVIALSKVAAANGGIYDSHMRDESSYSIGLLGSIRETIRIGKEAGIPVHISHIKALGKDVWGQSVEAIRIIRAARADGVKITADQYSYEASGTSITASLVPRWAEEGGSAALLKRIDDPAVRPRLIADMTANLERRGGAESLLITTSSNKDLIGKTLAKIAEERKESPIDAALEIVKARGAGVASFNMREDDIRNFMREDWVMTGSDGSAGHPRKYGTFPRKLRKYALDDHVITLPFAIRSNTSLTAETLGLKDRGSLKTGYFADVVVFDPATIADRATYVSPELLATGVRYLLVNGKLAVDNGRVSEILVGRPLKH